MRRVGECAGVRRRGAAQHARYAGRTVRSVVAHRNHAAGGVRLGGERARQIVSVREAVGL